MSNVILIDTPYGEEAFCGICGNSAEWMDCWNCENGYSHHDCGEDSCCCVDPEPNVECDVCHGEGGWYVCMSCQLEPKNCICKFPITVGNEEGDADIESAFKDIAEGRFKTFTDTDALFKDLDEPEKKAS